jgi:RNA polymerase sigma factor (sigma-70 family)
MEKDSFYIKKVQMGESAYFAFLVKKYQNHIFNIVNKAVGNYAASEDITQEVFFKAFKNIRSFDLNRPFFPYLVQIASNSLKDYFRSEKRMADMRSNFARISKRGTSFENIEKIQEIYDLIYLLPEDYREILLLHYRDGKSIKEISLLRGMTQGNVKVRLFRGRKMLFEIWKNNRNF